MTNCKQVLRAVNQMAMLGFLGVAMLLSAQTQAPKDDAGQIFILLANLSDHTKAPSDVLDPNLSSTDREKNLRHFSAPHYELSLTATGGVPVVTGDSASVPIHVHFDSKDGNSLDTNATAQFVKRNGTWYFSNFDFMSWPVFLILILVFGILVGIAYAVTVLVLMLKLRKHGQLGFNSVKMFFPIFWPSLFRAGGPVIK